MANTKFNKRVDMQRLKKIVVTLTVLVFSSSLLVPGAGLGLTIKEEEELSRKVMKMIFAHYPLIKDTFLVNYVNQLGQKLLSAFPPQPFTYHFYIVKDDVYNAFATPAGHIFINSGLFEAMESEEELAGIISHEISHVVCRHISQKIERSKKIGFATLAGVAAGVLLGMAGAGEAAGALTTGSMAAGQSMALAYSREDEVQADQIGLKYLNQAGYTGEGLMEILEKIRSRQWFGSGQIPTYLNTHPATEARMAYIDTWIQSEEKSIIFPSPKPSSDFQKAHTRLVALYGEKKSALKTFEAQVQKNPANSIAQYGYGLALARTGNRKKAVIHLKTALQKNALDPDILKEIGRIYFLEGRYEDALNTLEGSISLSPNDPVTLFYLGRTQISLGQLGEAVSTFEILNQRHPDYKEGLYFLGETYGKQGNLAEAHYYLGLYYIEIGKMRNAEFHLNRALDNTRDPDRKQKINAILRDIRRQAEDSKKAAKKNFNSLMPGGYPIPNPNL
jgi:predicted Zn-dependent protease